MLPVWGTGLGADPSPLAEGSVEAEQVRVAAVLLSSRAQAIPGLREALIPVFEAPSRDDALAALARLLGLLDRLVDEELPRLRQLVRVEAHSFGRWSAWPERGRIDAVATLREARGALPRQWKTWQTRRVAETPINRVLATRLRDQERLIERLASLRLHATHARVLTRARRALWDLLESSPLGQVAPAPVADLPALLREAGKRRAEWQKIAPFLAWCQAMEQTRLAALREEHGGTPLPAGACFEVAVTTGLLEALSRRFPVGEGLRFQAGAGPILAVLPTAPARTTLLLRGPAGAVELQARNLSLAAAQDLSAMVRPEVCLIIPGASTVASIYGVAIDALALPGALDAVLDRILPRLTGLEEA